MIHTELSDLFPVADGTGTYWAVGAGLGQTAFLNNDATKFTSVTLAGTITASGTVDFVNSDAPLRPTQISAYKTSAVGIASGPLIQIPYFITPITIPLVNAPAGIGPSLPGDTAHTVALNDSDLCGIFSGAFNNWNQVANPDDGNTKYPATAVTVVYDTSASGTTDLLTAHLAAVCPARGATISGTTATMPITFFETQSFATMFPAGMPTNFVAETGSYGVADQLVSYKAGTSVHAVGYLSPDFTNTFLAPSSATAQANQLSVASLRNTTTGTDFVPTFLNATNAVGTVATPTTLSDQTQWVPNASNPRTGYPISGTSQIILSQCYANHGNTPSVAASVVDFLTLHYSSNSALLNGNGFDSVPTNLKNAIIVYFLMAGGSRTNLDIGNSTACGKVAGR